MPDFSFEATSRFVDLPEGRLHYHEAGEGPALLLLHGSGPGVRGWANFEKNLPAFAGSFRCLIIDFPGYGDSDAVAGEPMSTCARAAIGLLDALGIERAHLIGNSLGGVVGSLVAAQHPERVDRFVSIGGIGSNVFSPFPAEGLRLLSAFAEDPTRERLVDWLHSMVYDPALVTEELIEERFKQATEPKTLATTQAIYSKQMLGAITQGRRANPTAALAHLANIKAPTLLTWGRDDRVTPLDGSLMPMRIVPNCELHVFPD
ncbi:MAG TPA: alpha/beta fold hydrolase, partial [Myxococcota bacterium]|nr:alpha/beta fold hydrolase [Myxococcota bacterium]